ncbi:MAG: hypothetical protein DIU78_001795 [Pseudomonadota bacterium]|nr:MAG: hypothetical protein DIU78_12380 [Pseudomonadota bacterium]
MSSRVRRSIRLVALAAACAGATACSAEEVKYEPRPAYSGAKASLPPVPNVAKQTIKNGDVYTVWGASYSLRSRVHRKDVAGKKLTIGGYIVKTNLPDAPECAVHRGGKADPEGCRPPIPAFWIGDTKDARIEDSIKVMGWASNFAQIYDAIKEFDKGSRKKDQEPEYIDTFWGVKVPNPLPAVGAKVEVTGTYATTFTQASTGAEADPFMGLLSYQEMKVIEPAEELATLPGVKRRQVKK